MSKQIVTIASAMLLFSCAAHADQSRCGSRKELSQALERRYSETPVAVGLIDARTIVEIFASADGDTWTFVTSRADGMSCIVSAGSAWQSVPAKPTGKPL